ncbi:MAG: tRNA 2-thiocytidine biosynthesis TtcA family protein [Bacteroidota bacterium]
MPGDLSLPRVLNRRIWRAVVEFGLLAPGDRVLVGFSGGKDSAFLLFALRSLQLHNRHVPFTLAAATLDPGFRADFPRDALADYAARLGVEWHLIESELGTLLAGRKDPCARCSFLRRGALCRVARELGYNRLALAHHHDDAVETFVMSIIYSGRIQTFLPRTELEGGLTVIRPLVYLRETEIRRALALTGFEPVPGGCPYEGETRRRRVKDLLRGLCRENRFVYTNLAAAMRAGRGIQLWPAEPGREELRRLHREYFG